MILAVLSRQSRIKVRYLALDFHSLRPRYSYNGTVKRVLAGSVAIGR